MNRWRRTYAKPAPLKDLLRPYREEGRTFGVALLEGVEDMPRLLAAIEARGLPRWKRPKERMPTEHHARWRWLWCGYNGGPDFPTFLRTLAPIAGLPLDLVHALWPPLRASRVLLPGGRGVLNRPAHVRLMKRNAELSAAGEMHAVHVPGRALIAFGDDLGDDLDDVRRERDGDARP